MTMPLIDPRFFAGLGPHGQFLVSGYAPMMTMANPNGMGNGQEWARAAGAYQQPISGMGASAASGQFHPQRISSQGGYFVSVPFVNPGQQQIMMMPQPPMAKAPKGTKKSATSQPPGRVLASSPGQIMQPDPRRRNSDFRTQIEAFMTSQGVVVPGTQEGPSQGQAPIVMADPEHVSRKYSQMNLDDSPRGSALSPRENERMDTSDSSSTTANLSAEISSSTSTSNSQAATQVLSETSRILSQNLGRLAFLVRQMESQAGYDVACKELVSWCDDQRAYAPSLCGDLNHTFEVLFYLWFTCKALT
jgi:hypothetical protein